jgi:copper(I)-binding protein
MKRTLINLLVAFAAALPGAAFAHEFKVGEIAIDHPWSRAMLPGAKVGGGYLTITNGGDGDRLVSATAERAGTVQIHEMKMDGGIMVMREMKGGIAVPAHGTLELKPGGYHIMFMNVTQSFKEGEEIKATLVFEKAGPVDVEFAVGPAGGGAMSHDAHAKGHGDHASGHDMAAMSGDPQQDIPARMKAIFETADKPLAVQPVVVEGDWAIAGWTQDGRGGRALLKKKEGGWSIHLCSGDGLKQAEALKTMGLSDDEAEAIVTKLAEAEEHIDPQTLALFASFEGTMMVEADDAGAHDQHKAHGDHKP